MTISRGTPSRHSSSRGRSTRVLHRRAECEDGAKRISVIIPGAERVCFTHVGVILSLVVILRVLLLLATLAAAFLAAAAVGKRCAQAGHVAEAAHRVDVCVGVLAVRCVCACDTECLTAQRRTTLHCARERMRQRGKIGGGVFSFKPQIFLQMLRSGKSKVGGKVESSSKGKVRRTRKARHRLFHTALPRTADTSRGCRLTRWSRLCNRPSSVRVTRVEKIEEAAASAAVVVAYHEVRASAAAAAGERRCRRLRCLPRTRLLALSSGCVFQRMEDREQRVHHVAPSIHAMNTPSFPSRRHTHQHTVQHARVLLVLTDTDTTHTHPLTRAHHPCTLLRKPRHHFLSKKTKNPKIKIKK